MNAPLESIVKKLYKAFVKDCHKVLCKNHIKLLTSRLDFTRIDNTVYVLLSTCNINTIIIDSKAQYICDNVINFEENTFYGHKIS